MRTTNNITIKRNGIFDSQLQISYWAEWMITEKGRKVYIRRDINAYQEAWVFDAQTDEYLGKANANQPASFFSTIWAIIQPFILKLIKKKVPITITKLYENLAKYTQPAIDSLFKLKGKIQNSPNELDDYCFNQGVNAIESFANYLLETVKTLRA